MEGVATTDERSGPIHRSILETTLSQLPLNVLLKIFSLLPLRSVLQLECLSQRMQYAVSAYLGTLKTASLFHEGYLDDQFRDFYPCALSSAQLSALLARCSALSEVAFIPASSSKGLSCDGVVSALSTHRSITRLGLCTSLELGMRIFNTLPHITIGTLSCSHYSNPLTIPPGCKVVRLQLHDVTLENGVPSLPIAEEIKLSNVTINFNQSYSAPDFPLLRCFSFSGCIKRQRGFNTEQCFATLLKAMTRSPHLVSLKLSLENFLVFQDVTDSGGLPLLRTFELSSAGLYSAHLQQFGCAGIVADFCSKSAASLEYLGLHSSVLVKQFFMHLNSNNIRFPRLQKFEVNGIADMKLFLAPGNLVESRYNQDFLNLCPLLSSLSLRSYSGSLSSLALPLTLTDITLPWDNRLNLYSQRADLYLVLSSLPHLEMLAIAGVEEVEGVIVEGLRRDVPALIVESRSLVGFKISNVHVSKLNLKGCEKLESFALHCCPVLHNLSLPAACLKRLAIYDSYQPYVTKFLEEFVSQRNHSDSCHIHIQLHSIRNVTDKPRPPRERGKELVASVAGTLAAASKHMKYCILKKAHMREFDHNSGEPMFPCTEFQPHPNLSGRSHREVDEENTHRSLVLEGARRWVNCLCELKSFAAKSDLPPLQGYDCESQQFEALYCGSKYECYTNIPLMLEINNSPALCQPSCIPPSGNMLLLLGVPRSNLHTSHCMDALSPKQSDSGSKPFCNSLSNPLLLVTIQEYVHSIHTLFYP